MAAPALGWINLLSILVKLGPKIPKAMELLKALYDLFAMEIAAVIPSGGTGELQQVQVTQEEEALMGQISAAMSAEGTQAALDFSRLRSLWKFLNDSGLASILITIFTKAALPI